MTNEEIIKLGTMLGLEFRESTNYPVALKNGRVVFDGCNGQRFLIEGSWSDEEIYSKIGESLIEQGMRMKAMEINRALSIN
jgi:hypothetical protein